MGAGKSTQLKGRVALLAVFAISLAFPRVTAAQVAVGQFLGGAATALIAHESGHLLLDATFGAGANLKKVNAGPLPFFAITHHFVSPAREFAISSAGFWVQHGTDEILFAKRPRLRTDRAWFLKGMFAFNVLTSVGYSVAAFVERGPDERDTRGMAASARISERWIGVTILAPAMLDGARYYRPDNPWLKWVSRGTKVGGALLVLRAAS